MGNPYEDSHDIDASGAPCDDGGNIYNPHDIDASGDGSNSCYSGDDAHVIEG